MEITPSPNFPILTCGIDELWWICKLYNWNNHAIHCTQKSFKHTSTTGGKSCVKSLRLRMYTSAGPAVLWIDRDTAVDGDWTWLLVLFASWGKGGKGKKTATAFRLWNLMRRLTRTKIDVTPETFLLSISSLSSLSPCPLNHYSVTRQKKIVYVKKRTTII